MLIRKIELENFMSHKNSTVELPDKGIVVITGANGSGKSSIAESVAVSVWGKTLRGSSPWVEGVAGTAKVYAEISGSNFTFTRGSTNTGKLRASFDPAPSSYSTVSKTQSAINNLAGPFDTWRKCSIFSSQDAAHFTLATDAERKRLLEGLLDLDKFDRALDECRKEKKEVIKRYDSFERSLWQAEAELKPITQEIEDTSKALGDVSNFIKDISGAPTSKSKRVEIEAMSAEISELREVVQTLSYDSAAIRGEISNLQWQEDMANQRIKSVDIDSCPTCGQQMHEDYKQRIQKEEKTKLTKIRNLLKDHRSSYEKIEAATQESIGKQLKITNLLDVARSDLSTIERQETLQGHLSERLEKFEKQAAVLIDKIKVTKRDLNVSSFDLSVIENSEDVLGIKGVRAHILMSALGALESMSNKWLKKIASQNANIQIKPYVKNKTGGTRDAISLDISGIGNGTGYKSLSGGQRRRVDVALLLGLAELAQPASALKKGTVFFDEVFDSLDADGIDSVSSVLAGMAEERPIIIISHSLDLVESLSPTIHYRVNSSTIRPQ